MDEVKERSFSLSHSHTWKMSQELWLLSWELGEKKTHFGSVTDLCRGLGLGYGNTEEQKGKKILTELY